MASRGASSLVVVVLAHLLSARAVSGDDKPRPRWELKDKPSVWESAWRHCEDSSGGSSSDASGYFSVQDVVPSPGSFAGRTGHSGSTKFTVDTNGKRVEEASRARASFFSPSIQSSSCSASPTKKKQRNMCLSILVDARYSALTLRPARPAFHRCALRRGACHAGFPTKGTRARRRL